MKLKELKKLIEGCHPEDLNNDVEDVVTSIVVVVVVSVVKN